MTTPATKASVSIGGIFEVLHGEPGGGGGPVEGDSGPSPIAADISVGDVESGPVSDLSGGFQQKGNLVGQFYNLAGLSLSANLPWVVEAHTRTVIPYRTLDDGSLLPLVPPSSVTWTAETGPIIVSVDGVVTGLEVPSNMPATVRADWQGFTADLNLDVFAEQEVEPQPEEHWTNLLGQSGSFDTSNIDGLSVTNTVIGRSRPLLGATQAGDVLGFEVEYDGASVTGPGQVQFGFTTLGSNFMEGVILILIDSTTPGEDRVRIQSLLSGAMLDFAVPDFSGSGTDEAQLTLIRTISDSWRYTLVVRSGGITILDTEGDFAINDMIGDARIQFAFGALNGTITGVRGTLAGSDVNTVTGETIAILQGTPGGGGGLVDDGLLTSIVFNDTSVGDEMAGGTTDLLGSGGIFQEMGNLIGQFYDQVGFAVTALPATVDEGATRQLEAALTMDDQSTIDVAESEVNWLVVAGPVAAIDSEGLATAGLVFENTEAIVQGTFGSALDELSLTIVNTEADNLPGYAADGIDDGWQVGYFGLPPNENAGPNANPDKDRDNNLAEFLFGFSPLDPKDYFQFSPLGFGPTGTFRMMANKVIPGRIYTLTSSLDLGETLPFAPLKELTFEAIQHDQLIEDDDPPVGGNNFYLIDVRLP